jgi:hypothetical protein
VCVVQALVAGFSRSLGAEIGKSKCACLLFAVEWFVICDDEFPRVGCRRRILPAIIKREFQINKEVAFGCY